MRIFSSAEYYFRVARRMSLIALAAPVWRVCNFCLIFVPFDHYDEPETLPYEIRLVCSIGADVKHEPPKFGQYTESFTSGLSLTATGRRTIL